MIMPDIQYCPGTLAEGFDTYSQACLRRLFNGKKVSHILPYNPPEVSEEDAEKFMTRDRDEPFCLFICSVHAHAPWNASDSSISQN